MEHAMSLKGIDYLVDSADHRIQKLLKYRLTEEEKKSLNYIKKQLDDLRFLNKDKLPDSLEDKKDKEDLKKLQKNLDDLEIKINNRILETSQHDKNIDYKYDIFLSYDESVERWVECCFLEAFTLYFTDEIGQHPNIYKNKQTHSQNELCLKEALGYSRCLIPLWTPQYFRKQWWKYEYHSMRYRSQTTSKFLIFPFILCDGQSFPKIVEEITIQFNLRDYIVPESFVEGYIKSEHCCNKFKETMRDKTKRIVSYIREIPAWNKDWLKEPEDIIPTELEEVQPQFVCPAL